MRSSANIAMLAVFVFVCVRLFVRDASMVIFQFTRNRAKELWFDEN